MRKQETSQLDGLKSTFSQKPQELLVKLLKINKFTVSSGIPVSKSGLESAINALLRSAGLSGMSSSGPVIASIRRGEGRKPVTQRGITLYAASYSPVNDPLKGR